LVAVDASLATAETKIVEVQGHAGVRVLFLTAADCLAWIFEHRRARRVLSRLCPHQREEADDASHGGAADVSRRGR